MHAMGPSNVVVTGGHSDEGTDYFFDGETIEPIPGPRHPPGATHGSGCTHSSALAAHMALGMGALEAAREARRIAGEAVAAGLHDLGSGPGPVDVLGTVRGAAPSIIDSMKLLRMTPGKGDVLLAEGDPDVAEDEERLVEEFRRQLDLGMWAAVPTEERGRHEATMVRDFSEVPAGTERVIFFPQAAGG